MNFSNQYPSDQKIERDLGALRQEPTSASGLGNAIRTMQARPESVNRPFAKWSVRLLTTAAVGACAFAAISLTTGKAYAQELAEVSAAQQQHKTMVMRSTMFFGRKDVPMRLDLWLDGDREAYYQYQSNGQISYISASDGKLRKTYAAGDPSVGLLPSATIDVDRSEHLQIETVNSYLNAKFFKNRKIEKKTDVLLNGKKYDYYSLANGYYRLWIDPETKLPAQREIYDKGVTLWQRDTYEYPASIPDIQFRPELSGVKFFDYPATRKLVAERLQQPGQSQTIGGVTITLKAVVKDSWTVNAIWTSTGYDNGGAKQASLKVQGGVEEPSFVSNLSALPSFKGPQLLTERVRFYPPVPTGKPLTVKIAAWSTENKLAGWVTFTVQDPMSCPSAAQLLALPNNTVGVAKTSAQ